MKTTMNIVLIISFLLFPLVIILKIPLFNASNNIVLFLLKSITCFGFIWAFIRSLKRKNKKLIIAGIILGIITLSAIYSDLSTRLFLGKEIANAYYAEAPGYIELQVYDSGKCLLSYGGIMGASDIFIGHWKVDKDLFKVKINADLLELSHYSEVFLNGESYQIMKVNRF